jgi:hypothetical protein
MVNGNASDTLHDPKTFAKGYLAKLRKSARVSSKGGKRSGRKMTDQEFADTFQVKLISKEIFKCSTIKN